MSRVLLHPRIILLLVAGVSAILAGHYLAVLTAVLWLVGGLLAFAVLMWLAIAAAEKIGLFRLAQGLDKWMQDKGWQSKDQAMPLFEPEKVARINFAYYWADHEAIYVEKIELHDPAAMERFPTEYYLGWLTLHQISSLSLPYKEMLRDALESVAALEPSSPQRQHVVARWQENRVITLRTTWYQHRSGVIVPNVRHDLGAAAERRGMTIEEAVVRALAKIWRVFAYEQLCSLLAQEEFTVDLISYCKESIRQGVERDEADIQRLEAQLTENRADWAETEAETTRAALRGLLDDWQESGFPQGVGGAQRIS